MTYDRVAKDIAKLLKNKKDHQAQAQARLLIGLIRHLGHGETSDMIEVGSIEGQVFISFARPIRQIGLSPIEAHQLIQTISNSTRNAELGIEAGTILTFGGA